MKFFDTPMCCDRSANIAMSVTRGVLSGRQRFRQPVFDQETRFRRRGFADRTGDEDFAAVRS